MYWIHPKHPDAAKQFEIHLHSLIRSCNLNHQPLLFICIGTPSVLGDCLGPLVGSALHSKVPAPVYGTLDAPIHALNYTSALRSIKKQHQRPFIIAIDAALGSLAQSGYILLKKGPLHPGKGVGKQLPPIGHLQITGVFQDLCHPAAGGQVAAFSRCISQGILKLYPSLESTKERDFVNVLQVPANRNTAGNSTDFNPCRFN
jgi:putative sporulation protein YyaC